MRTFSGIQPTGQKHFGVYSGAFRQFVPIQEESEAFFCIVDLHSITTDYEPPELRESTLSLAALLFASGLDPDRARSSSRATCRRTRRPRGCSARSRASASFAG